MANSVERIETKILAFVRNELLAPGQTAERDDDLLSDLLDSMAVLRLANFVDEEFGLTTRPQDFVVENFESAATIARYVERSRSEPKDD